MGNRGVIRLNQPGMEQYLYLHWQGGRDSVEGFLEVAKELRLPPNNQGLKALAHIINDVAFEQTEFNWPEKQLTVYIEEGSGEGKDLGDHGIYVVDLDWNIVGREGRNQEEGYLDGKPFKEQDVYDPEDIKKWVLDTPGEEEYTKPGEKRARIEEIIPQHIDIQGKAGEFRDSEGNYDWAEIAKQIEDLESKNRDNEVAHLLAQIHGKPTEVLFTDELVAKQMVGEPLTDEEIVTRKHLTSEWMGLLTKEMKKAVTKATTQAGATDAPTPEKPAPSAPSSSGGDDGVAETILEQLGGGEFRMMTGARDLVSGIGDHGGLQFKITKGKDGVDKVVIKYDKGLDLYDVEFWNMRTKEPTLLKVQNMVYADDLRDVFTANTGLYTSSGLGGSKPPERKDAPAVATAPEKHGDERVKTPEEIKALPLWYWELVLSDYQKKEDVNFHSEAALLLAKEFGTHEEVAKMKEIIGRQEVGRGISKEDYDWRYQNINPYYYELLSTIEGLKQAGATDAPTPEKKDAPAVATAPVVPHVDPEAPLYSPVNRPQEYSDITGEPKRTENPTVLEGQAGFDLGSSIDMNPYEKALKKMMSGEEPYDDGRYASLRKLSLQWETGYHMAEAADRRQADAHLSSPRRPDDEGPLSDFHKGVLAEAIELNKGERGSDEDLANAVSAVLATKTELTEVDPYKDDYDERYARGHIDDLVRYSGEEDTLRSPAATPGGGEMAGNMYDNIEAAAGTENPTREQAEAAVLHFLPGMAKHLVTNLVDLYDRDRGLNQGDPEGSKPNRYKVVDITLQMEEGLTEEDAVIGTAWASDADAAVDEVLKEEPSTKWAYEAAKNSGQLDAMKKDLIAVPVSEDYEPLKGLYGRTQAEGPPELASPKLGSRRMKSPSLPKGRAPKKATAKPVAKATRRGSVKSYKDTSTGRTFSRRGKGGMPKSKRFTRA